MNREELHDFASRYTQAWCSHDADATAAFFAESGSIGINDGEPAVGRVEIAQLVQGFYDAFPDTVVIMDAVRGAADKAVYLWTYEGTNTGPGGTGKRVRFNGWEAWTLSDEGLISESIGTFDSEEYERQLAAGV
ncbi:MAG: nuclear transport factor 2 family protein [Acidimicrobiia bacterium]